MSDLGYCRELALDLPLIGTAPEGTRWVLVEDNGRWGAKPPRESELPDPVKLWLRGLERPGTRIHLIRRPAGARPGARPSTRKLILASTPASPEQRRLVELDVELDRIPELDVDALLAAAGEASSAPLWLVCTHGARDRCCAKWGMPVFEALRARDPERVWQSSHLGGHRFAPTFVALPFGLMWGRVPVDRVAAIDQALARAELAGVEHLRGRSCWPSPAQAAEGSLRQAEPGLPIDALILREQIELAPGRHRVEFEVRGGLGRRSVEVETIELPPAPGSCGDTPERGRGLAIVSSR
ncbi:sucrase ferredoxin [Nannocystaceae bacterium ST9]